ncbi:MAG: hypothetical protein LBU32_07915 [Clostridiales bacterium]|nr:hypothetical protein [Clostridiales bacterium]
MESQASRMTAIRSIMKDWRACKLEMDPLNFRHGKHIECKLIADTAKLRVEQADQKGGVKI